MLDGLFIFIDLHPEPFFVRALFWLVARRDFVTNVFLTTRKRRAQR